VVAGNKADRVAKDRSAVMAVPGLNIAMEAHRVEEGLVELGAMGAAAAKAVMPGIYISPIRMESQPLPSKSWRVLGVLQTTQAQVEMGEQEIQLAVQVDPGRAVKLELPGIMVKFILMASQRPLLEINPVW